MSLIKMRLNEYEKFIKQFKEQGNTFEVSKTKYTRRIKAGKNTILFSDKPMTSIELKMIQQIRTSADTFEVPTMEEKAPQISFYKFFDIREEDTFKGIKIDLNQAYWQSAINIGLITPKIQLYFEENKLKLGGEKEVKTARLRSLGSLATQKNFEIYENGKMIHEELIVNKAHRELYLYICSQVAEVMHELAFNFMEHVVYYYWDCIWLDDKVDMEAVNQKVIDLGFASKLEGQGEYKIIRGEHVSYLLDVDKGTQYPIMNTDIIK